MLLAELAEVSDTSAASIKFYRREGLLPPGRRITATRQDYGEPHLVRLQLIGVLREQLDASITQIRAVTQALDDPDRPLVEALAEAQALTLGVLGGSTDEATAEHPAVAPLLERLDWPDIHSQPRRALSDLLHQLDAWGVPADPGVLDRFARAMQEIAASDLTAMRAGREAEDPPTDDLMVIRAVRGTIAYDRLMSTLRSLAHASLTMRAS